MPYVRVPDPNLNADKPGRSTDIKQIRDNQDYFSSQIDTLVLKNLISSNSIADDFMGTALGPWWVSVVGTGDTAAIISQHKLRCLTNGNTTSDYAGVKAATGYQRVVKTEEYVAVMEVRVKRPGTDAGSYVFGWNDDALTLGAEYGDTTDCVLVIRDAFGNWTAKTSNGGSSSSYGSFGNASIWERVRLEFTCSATAGNRKVEIYLNDALLSTLNTDANMPTASLVPVLGTRGDTTGAASREIHFDYAIFTVKARPLAA